MKKLHKRILASFMAICILFTVLPITAKADNSDYVNRYTVLVLDTSDSIEFYVDGEWIYTADTAIDYVKKASKKFLYDVVKAKGNNHVAIVSYNSEAEVLSDFTQDIEDLNYSIDNLYCSDERRSIAEGLEVADSLLANVSDENAIKNIVIFSTGMTDIGEYNYYGHYGDDTVGSAWCNMETDVNLYAYANIAYNKAQEIKEQGTYIYSIGLFQVMDGMPRDGEEVVEFFELTAKELASDADYFYSVANPDDLEFVFGEVADDVISNTKKTGKFYYASGSEKDYQATYFYDDDYFTKSAYIYQDSLATMSMCLAFSAFGSNRVPNTTEGYKEKSQNLKYLLSECGFSEENFATNDGFKRKPDTDSIGVGASYKTITVDGENYTLIGVAVRGGGYESEWASNFTIGTTGLHQGFSEARDQVISFLEDYIRDKGITGKVKLWIAGYSRAAATTNLVAGKLDSGYSLSDAIELKNEDIYAYCFEAPKGGLVVYDVKNYIYNNIHSIINPADMVTKVAPTTPREFGFERYGNTKFLPTALNKEAENYESAKKKMLKKYKALESVGDYIVDDFQMKKISIKNLTLDMLGLASAPIFVDDSDEKWDQNAFLDTTLEKLFSENMKNRSNYVKVYEDDIREILKVLCGTPSEKWNDFGDEFLNCLKGHIGSIIWYLIKDDKVKIIGEVEEAFIEALNNRGITDYSKSEVNAFACKVVNLVMSFGIRHPNLTATAVYNFKGLGAAHYPELCLAWLQSFDKNYTPDGEAAFSSGMYRIVRINCPVNINVYDDNNNLVASIIDDASQEIAGSSLVSYVNENGEKLIYLPASAEYNVKIDATDEGSMTYSINEYSEVLGTTNRIVNYHEVELSKGDVFTGVVPCINEDEFGSDDISGSLVQYQLLDGDNNELPLESDLNGRDAVDAYYNINVTSNNIDYGIVYGSDTAKLGAYVKIVAVPYEGCNFEGWYEGSTLISTEKEYRFCVEEDMDIVGIFEKEYIHEHDYSVAFNWEEDYKSCMATFVCNEKDDTQSLDCNVISEISDGQNVYTATVEFQGKTYTDVKTDVISEAEDSSEDKSDDSKESTRDKTKSDTHTGEISDIILWVVLIVVAFLVISVLAIIGVLVYKKRRKTDQ